jgi:hypothetical protein
MDAVLTLVVANKPKKKYKCKQKEKDGKEVKIMQLPKLEAKLVGEDLNSMSKSMRAFVEGEETGATKNLGLSTLHSLLVQFIEQDLEDCDTFVFAPGHGYFAALHDDRKVEFLVVIPSIVSL